MSERKVGYIKIGVIYNAPVFMHWSFPLGVIFVALFFLRSSHEQVVYVCIAYAVLIVAHELGHATAAWAFKLKVYSVELSGMGGECNTETPQSRLTAFTFVGAGLIVQAIILIATVVYDFYYGWPSTIAGESFTFVFTSVNALLIILNLLPYKVRREDYGTDGYILWKLSAQLIKGSPYGYPDTSATLTPKESLLKMERFVPKKFKVGIEIFNDNTTTMEFVVNILMQNLNYSKDKAIEVMLEIHDKGGVLISLDTYEEAQRISSAISDESKKEGYNFVCRPVKISESGPDN